MPLKYFQMIRKVFKPMVPSSCGGSGNGDWTNLKPGARIYLAAYGFGDELGSQANSQGGDVEFNCPADKLKFPFNPGIPVIHGHRPAHHEEKLWVFGGKALFGDEATLEVILTVGESLLKNPGSFKADMLEAKSPLHDTKS